MGRKRHTPEQIITALREAEVGLARGKSVKLISRELGITEQTSGCPNDRGHQPSDGGRATHHATTHCTEYPGCDENRRASDTRIGHPLAHEGARECYQK